MEKIKHAVASVKEKVTGHHGQEQKHDDLGDDPVSIRTPYQPTTQSPCGTFLVAFCDSSNPSAYFS
jgi:hypothetical protein